MMMNGQTSSLMMVLGLCLMPYGTMGQPEMMCARTKGGVIEHEQYCDSYYRCDRNGNPILEQCPNGLAFAGHRRGLASYCDYPHRVGCPDGTKVMGQAPIKSEGCEWSFGIFAHDTSCTRYWQCWNGTATLQQCPFSLLYNEQLKACDWADNVPDCQKHPICKESPNGSVAIEKSCTRYWLCVGGYPRIQRCPAGLAFNRETQKCDLDYTVPGCEPPPIVSNDLEGNNDNNNEKSSNGNGNSINSNNRDSILA